MSQNTADDDPSETGSASAATADAAVGPPDPKNLYKEARSSLKSAGCEAFTKNKKSEEVNPVEKLLNTTTPEAKKKEFLVLNYPQDIRRNLKQMSSKSFEDPKKSKGQRARRWQTSPTDKKQT